MKRQNMEGSVIVVTGASGRLGRRMVKGFADRGATLAAVDRQAGRVQLPPMAQGAVYTADVTDEAAVRRCFEEIAGRFGHIDVLVHTVGTWAATPLLETPLGVWEHMLRLNLTSTFLCFREAARLMGGRGGRLIGIASGQGADQGRARQAAYSAAKAGVIRLVEAVAEEFKQEGITAHALAPSMILFDDAEGSEGVSADHLVELACYLCSPASTALNGATLRAYGRM